MLHSDPVRDPGGASLSRIFDGSHCIVQRLGDKNQAIFGPGSAETDGAMASNIVTSQLQLPESHRLASRLATMVSSLGVVHPVSLVGNARRPDRAHTIFCFSDATIHGVLPAYGDLILREWGGSPPQPFVAKAVGFRKKPRTSEALPVSLHDYCAGWVPTPGELRVPRTSLLAAAVHAHALVRADGANARGYRAALDAIAFLVELRRGERRSGDDLARAMKEGKVKGQEVRSIVARLLDPLSLTSGPIWEALTSDIAVLCGLRTPSVETTAYLAWGETPTEANVEGSPHYAHRSFRGEVSIEVATIHAVKGETHDTTLVLETLWRKHDIRGPALRLLAGQSVGKEVGPEARERLKRLFVGATRPRELLCLGVHERAMTTDTRRALEDAGWAVRDVEAPVRALRA